MIWCLQMHHADGDPRCVQLVTSIAAYSKLANAEHLKR